MANKVKNKIREQTKNRARIFRGIRAIIKQDNISLVNTMQLRKKMLTSNLSTASEKVETPSLADKLRSWSIDFYIRKRAINALLQILRHFGIQSLPADSRSLLKTPRTIKIDALSGVLA